MSRKIAQDSVHVEKVERQASFLDQKKEIQFQTRNGFYIYLIILPML